MRRIGLGKLSIFAAGLNRIAPFSHQSAGSSAQSIDAETLTMAAPANRHPTDETLRAYSLGQLDDILAEAVERHLEECPDCRGRAAVVSSDSFLERLRDAVGAAGTGSFLPQVSISFEPGRTSVLASLAESLGGLPQVLLRDTDLGEEPSPVVKPGSPEMPGAEDRSGRYQLLGEIARGGMGAVLRGATATSAATSPSRSCSRRTRTSPS